MKRIMYNHFTCRFRQENFTSQLQNRMSGTLDFRYLRLCADFTIIMDAFNGFPRNMQNGRSCFTATYFVGYVLNMITETTVDSVVDWLPELRNVDNRQVRVSNVVLRFNRGVTWAHSFHQLADSVGR